MDFKIVQPHDLIPYFDVLSQHMRSHWDGDFHFKGFELDYLMARQFKSGNPMLTYLTDYSGAAVRVSTIYHSHEKVIDAMTVAYGDYQHTWKPSQKIIYAYNSFNQKEILIPRKADTVAKYDQLLDTMLKYTRLNELVDLINKESPVSSL